MYQYILRYIKKLIEYLYHINDAFQYAKVEKVYNVNRCKIRYNLLSYRTERIKGIIEPKYISQGLFKKIMHDVELYVYNKNYHIKKIKRNESILLYQDGELVNNTINNIILYNITHDDEQKKIEKILDVC